MALCLPICLCICGKESHKSEVNNVLEINGTHITITRGDCEPFTITFTGEDVPADGEKVLFSVKKNVNSPNAVLEKELELRNSQVVIHIMNADTKNLSFGDYQWDVRFPDYSGVNEPYTPMKPAEFTIATVIGDV